MTFKQLSETNNVDHFYNKVESSLKKTLSQYYSTLKRKKDISPLKLFLESHSAHPQINELKAALKNKNKLDIDKLLNKIGADGWKEFLSKTTRSNTSAFFTYLAKADGRKTWGITPSDSSPLLVNGQIVIDEEEKCRENLNSL